MSVTRLVWLQTPPERCSDGSVPKERVAVLQLEFEGRRALLRLNLSFCAADQTYAAELPLLGEALAEVDYTPADVLEFAVDGETVQAAVSLGGLGEVPWEVYTAGLAAGSQWLEAPLPTAEALLELPLLPEVWTLAQEAGTYYLDEAGEPTLSYVALLTTPGGLVRSVTLTAQPADPLELRELILKGCALPPGDLPAARPEVVAVADPFLVESLALADLGIRAELGDVTPALEALASLKEALGPEAVPSYFSAYPEGEVKAFFAAAHTFFHAKPWEVVDGTKFLAFRLAGGPWHYANVMGQAGEAFGLAMFGSWLEVCRTLNNPETMMDMLASMSRAEETAETTPKSLLAVGHAEGLSLSPLQALAPEDAAFLEQLGVKPSLRAAYAAVHRYTPEGLETPAFSPAVYTGLLSVLAERTRKRRGEQISSIKAKTSTPAGELEVRYPARGDEGSSRSGYYRFQVPFHLSAGRGATAEVIQAEIEAPGEAKWHRVMGAVIKGARAHPDIFPWPPNLKEGEYLVWLDQAPVREPSPTVEQVAGLTGLTLAGYEYEDPLVLTSLPRPTNADIKVTFLEKA